LQAAAATADVGSCGPPASGCSAASGRLAASTATVAEPATWVCRTRRSLSSCRPARPRTVPASAAGDHRVWQRGSSGPSGVGCRPMPHPSVPPPELPPPRSSSTGSAGQPQSWRSAGWRRRTGETAPAGRGQGSLPPILLRHPVVKVRPLGRRWLGEVRRALSFRIPRCAAPRRSWPAPRNRPSQVADTRVPVRQLAASSRRRLHRGCDDPGR
jgi:hypothetical protein